MQALQAIGRSAATTADGMIPCVFGSSAIETLHRGVRNPLELDRTDDVIVAEVRMDAASKRDERFAVVA